VHDGSGGYDRLHVCGVRKISRHRSPETEKNRTKIVVRFDYPVQKAYVNQIATFHFTGFGGADLTLELFQILSRGRFPILDIARSHLHGTFFLGLLVEIPPDFESDPLLVELRETAHSHNIQFHFLRIEPNFYRRTFLESRSCGYTVTLLGKGLDAPRIATLLSLLASRGLEVCEIRHLAGTPESDSVECIEFSLAGEPHDPSALRSAFLDLSAQQQIDVAFQKNDLFRRTRRLIAFDMDSTLIQAEVIDELAREAGVMEQVAAITEAAMRGELDFQESFRKRLSLIEGLDESALERVAARLPLTEGADVLLRTVKKYGYKVAILSGGFTYFGKLLQKRWGVDYLHANELEIENGKVTGRIKGEIVDGKRKAALLEQIVRDESIHFEQVVAVGDGANDLPMLNLAGLGIAFHAKPVVTQEAKHSLSTVGLDGILYFLGMHERDFVHEEQG